MSSLGRTVVTPNSMTSSTVRIGLASRASLHDTRDETVGADGDTERRPLVDELHPHVTIDLRLRA
jgi:hypothetical protein